MESPITLERLHAVGVEIYTTDQAVRLARVVFGPDTGFTEREARAYAAAFAQAPALLEIARQFVEKLEGYDDSSILESAYDEVQELLTKLRPIVTACEPKPKGQPFKQPERTG